MVKEVVGFDKFLEGRRRVAIRFRAAEAHRQRDAREDRKERSAPLDSSTEPHSERGLDVDDGDERPLCKLAQLDPRPQVGGDKVLAPVAGSMVEKVGRGCEVEMRAGRSVEGRGRGGRNGGDVYSLEGVGDEEVGEGSLAGVRGTDEADEHFGGGGEGVGSLGMAGSGVDRQGKLLK